MITQEELEKYTTYKVKIKEKSKKLKLAEAAIKDMEARFISRLESKEKVEKGTHYPRIKETEGRASISWKDIVEKLKGLAYVEELIQGAKRGIVKKLEVIVGIQK